MNKTSSPGSNLLTAANSPYLKQHAGNPVWWQPWGAEALARARAENKPIFLSIGYSTCYWCHVMEKDSFEIESVAALLNEHFVSIKVDREEHPDVDAVYMDAVVACTGHGGWPMSVFLTPEGKPLYGGTYYPRAQFVQILQAVAKAWQHEPEKVLAGAEELCHSLAETIPAQEALVELPFDLAKHGVEILSTRYDCENGGFSAAPKFPQLPQLLFLLDYASQNEDAIVLDQVVSTVEAMLRGGIYDHVFGGLARYATDDQWLVPHFEKMLYDNAQWLSLLAKLYRVTGKAYFRSAAEKSATFLKGSFSAPAGGFCSAYDAGEVDREGEYYVFEHSELEAAPHFRKLERELRTSISGNFEHGQNIIALKTTSSLQLLSDPTYDNLMNELAEVRNRRQRPHRDDKVILGWNALMVSAFVDCYLAFGVEQYKQDAVLLAKMLSEVFYNNAVKVPRHLVNSEASGEAVLEDHALYLRALADLYQIEDSPIWVEQAQSVRSLIEEKFRNDHGELRQSTQLLYKEKIDLLDGPLPSGLGALAQAAVRWSALNGDTSWDSIIQGIVTQSRGVWQNYPHGCSTLTASLLLAASNYSAWTIATLPLKIANLPLASPIKVRANQLEQRCDRRGCYPLE